MSKRLGDDVWIWVLMLALMAGILGPGLLDLLFTN